METIVRCAKTEDTNKLTTFLENASLSAEGIEQAIDYFLVLEDDKGNINATLGIEPLGEIGLLRSLVMTSKTSEKELLMMFEQMLLLARDKHLKSLYLATNKSGTLPFFSMMGFVKEEKNLLPEELFQSDHVKHILTVDNSLFMKLTI
ncbi:hypothetical protein SM124_08555 [Bacillus sp. 31A1R]|uniref:N-acetyltransferase domain-containing protein n=1 Tax=Robertmurraya mangrovi TaxID=3098077 RepID=A0ABU5IXA9_9BACI|nr:hypothetical protein [Bacillus sp. 31A1R]MDZ5471797.1 hypothetical protein [Bacillus sp. 31A1R]